MQKSTALLPTRPEDLEKWRRVIVVLDGIHINGAKKLKTPQKKSLASFAKSAPTNASETRPKLKTSADNERLDILHQCLLHLLESPLSLGGKLEIFLHTDCGTLIRVDSRYACPIFFDDFYATLQDLFLTRRVKAKHAQEIFSVRQKRVPINLLKIVKNPISAHLPISQEKCIKIFNLSENARQHCMKSAIQSSLIDNENMPLIENVSSGRAKGLSMSPLFVIGAFKNGSIDVNRWKNICLDYGPDIEEIKFGDQELSAARCCALLTCEYELALGL